MSTFYSICFLLFDKDAIHRELESGVEQSQCF